MAARPRNHRTAQLAAARRRRVLLVLVAIATSVGALSVFDLLPWWSFMVPLVSVVAFLYVGRRQVRLADEAYWIEAARQRPQSSNVVRRSAVRVDASHGSARDPADEEPTVEFPVVSASIAEQRVQAISLSTADGGALWDPLPITLPTYVEKATAPRSIRTVELGSPETWPAGHSGEDSDLVARAKSDADVLAESPRVVNG